MTQPAKRVDLRAQMPNSARIIAKRRDELGVPYVNDCIRRSLAGEPGLFLAIEKGFVLGTPFPLGHAYEAWQAQAIVWGVDCAVFLKGKEELNGTN